MKREYAPPVNAYLEPNNPNAVFPQRQKMVIRDFRVHKMESGGLTATNVFRKHLTENSKKSKYATVVRTQAELEAGAPSLLAVPEVKAEVEKPVTVAELTDLASRMKIGKKPKAAKDVEMSAPKIEIKSKGINKYREKACRKSKRMMKF